MGIYTCTRLSLVCMHGCTRDSGYKTRTKSERTRLLVVGKVVGLCTCDPNCHIWRPTVHTACAHRLCTPPLAHPLSALLTITWRPVCHVHVYIYIPPSCPLHFAHLHFAHRTHPAAHHLPCTCTPQLGLARAGLARPGLGMSDHALALP